MEKTEKTVEELAEAYADSKERRLTSYWKGLKDGYMEGHDKARNQAIQDCIDIFKDEFSLSGEDVESEDWALTKRLESLRTKQITSN